MKQKILAVGKYAYNQNINKKKYIFTIGLVKLSKIQPESVYDQFQNFTKSSCN